MFNPYWAYIISTLYFYTIWRSPGKAMLNEKIAARGLSFVFRELQY